MALAFPFRAFRYSPARAPFERVLTQPYDKISPAMQEKYYAADPHNLIAVEKGRGNPDDTPQNNVYTRAAATLGPAISKTILPASSSATSKPSRARKPIVLNFSVTRKRTPASFL